MSTKSTEFLHHMTPHACTQDPRFFSHKLFSKCFEIKPQLMMAAAIGLPSVGYKTWCACRQSVCIVCSTIREVTKPLIHYGNQSRGYFNGGRPHDHPLCPGLQPGPPSETPGGLGQRYWSVSMVTWPPKPGVSEVGVFRGIQPNEQKKNTDYRPSVPGPTYLEHCFFNYLHKVFYAVANTIQMIYSTFN